ncbi:MAG: hypothetical protein WBG66_07015 [Geitlerinemataceae cyanobacterium]
MSRLRESSRAGIFLLSAGLSMAVKKPGFLEEPGFYPYLKQQEGSHLPDREVLR